MHIMYYIIYFIILIFIWFFVYFFSKTNEDKKLSDDIKFKTCRSIMSSKWMEKTSAFDKIETTVSTVWLIIEIIISIIFIPFEL